MKQCAKNKKKSSSFFHYKPNLWIIGTSFILLVFFYYGYLIKDDLAIFPKNSTINIDYFNDSIVGGNSKIIQHSASDTAISLTFNLKEGFINPYVGINIAPKNNSTIDLSQYNQFQFEIEGNDIKNIIAVIITRNINTDISSKIRELYFTGNFEITPNRRQFHLYLEQLKIPDWWYEVNKLSPSKKLLPDFQHVIRINFANGSTPIGEVKRSLRIYSILFTRNNTTLIILLVIAEFIILLLLIVMHYFRFYSRKKNLPVTITYKPVDIENENKQLRTFLDYINSNFYDNNLNLENVSRFTGINQRRIADTILKTFGCNFKTYINQIRINESKRLLLKSELNIGEIAFRVGFNNQSHFNRVFKSIVRLSPSEFIETRQ